jgi:hypothetical protein
MHQESGLFEKGNMSELQENQDDNSTESHDRGLLHVDLLVETATPPLAQGLFEGREVEPAQQRAPPSCKLFKVLVSWPLTR